VNYCHHFDSHQDGYQQQWHSVLYVKIFFSETTLSNRSKLCRNISVLYIIIICDFGADPIFNMVVRANNAVRLVNPQKLIP
jgi:hypothetical protein